MIMLTVQVAVSILTIQHDVYTKITATCKHKTLNGAATTTVYLYSAYSMIMLTMQVAVSILTIHHDVYTKITATSLQG